MRKMRAISDAYQEIVKKDPYTSITMHAFRSLINEGRIPYINIGRKKLVSMEDVYDFFDKK